jgi:concentrative nucleoside transporter, CNT family
MSFPIALLRGLLGIAVILAIAYGLSKNRKAIPWRTVGIGLGLQVIFALFVLKTSFGAAVFQTIGEGFTALLGFTLDGAAFLFGNLARGTGEGSVGFVFAFQILPTIIFFGAFTSVLYHLGILQVIVRAVGLVMAKAMRLSGAESLSAAGNIFLGQTEAPLLVKPYVRTMTHSELFALMVGGMATLAGGVLASYIALLGGDDPVARAAFARDLLSASIMNAPAALFLAKMMIPETETPLTTGTTKLESEKAASNVIEAAASGASDGLMLALNVGAMLLAFIALIALINALLGWLGNPTFGDYYLWDLNAAIERASGGRFDGLSFQSLFGFLFAPFAWAIGIESRDILLFGSLLGQKVAVNEFVAYLDLSALKDQLTPRSVTMATYALCGFANFSSIAIQIGGVGGLAPERRGEIASLGLRAVLAGSLATALSATIAGILLGR